MAHKILVIEDFELLQKMYVDILTRFDYDVITADNGRDGLRLATADQPDIVILDIDLPQMSGVDVLKRLREQSNTKDLRIMIITSNHLIQQSDAVNQADLTLLKPISPADLVGFVQRLIPLDKVV